MAAAQDSAAGSPRRPAVLVSGPSENAVRRFLAAFVKRALGLKKPQWRAKYRETYGLAVLSHVLHGGESAADAYAPYAGLDVLVLACLAADVPGSGRRAVLDWLKASGFSPIVELSLPAAASRESELVELGAEVVTFVSNACPWRGLPPEADSPGGV